MKVRTSSEDPKHILLLVFYWLLLRTMWKKVAQQSRGEVQSCRAMELQRGQQDRWEVDLSFCGASHRWFKEREESFSMQQEPWSTQKESASLLERATSKYFTFLSGAAGFLRCLSHLLTNLQHYTEVVGGTLWLRLQIMQMACEREWKGETAARGSII